MTRGERRYRAERIIARRWPNAMFGPGWNWRRAAVPGHFRKQRPTSHGKTASRHHGFRDFPPGRPIVPPDPREFV